jgi:hypothetical protein
MALPMESKAFCMRHVFYDGRAGIERFGTQALALLRFVFQAHSDNRSK